MKDYVKKLVDSLFECFGDTLLCVSVNCSLDYCFDLFVNNIEVKGKKNEQGEITLIFGTGFFLSSVVDQKTIFNAAKIASKGYAVMFDYE